MRNRERSAYLAAAIAAVAVIWLAVPQFARASDPAEEARQVVTTALERMEAVIGDPQATPAEKRALVEKEIRANLDFGYLTLAALGPMAEQFSREQITDFSHEYVRYLTYMLLQQSAGRKREPPEILDATLDEKTGHVTVRTMGSRGLLDFPQQFARHGSVPERLKRDFVLRQRDGQWRIIGLSFNEVSVSRNFRAQFEAILKRSDPAELIRKLAEQNDKNEARNPFDGKAS